MSLDTECCGRCGLPLVGDRALFGGAECRCLPVRPMIDDVPRHERAAADLFTGPEHDPSPDGGCTRCGALLPDEDMSSTCRTPEPEQLDALPGPSQITLDL
jgi:hypothetical protein